MRRRRWLPEGNDDGGVSGGWGDHVYGDLLDGEFTVARDQVGPFAELSIIDGGEELTSARSRGLTAASSLPAVNRIKVNSEDARVYVQLRVLQVGELINAAVTNLCGVPEFPAHSSTSISCFIPSPTFPYTSLPHLLLLHLTPLSLILFNPSTFPSVYLSTSKYFPLLLFTLLSLLSHSPYSPTSTY